MSTSNIKKRYLKVFVSNEFQYYVKLTLFDASNRIHKSEFSNRYEYRFSVTQGLYTLRVSINAEVVDEVIYLDQDKEYEIAPESYASGGNRNIIVPPKLYSSALIGETYSSSHEYYTGPAVQWSRKETLKEGPFTDSNENSSLFIFMRFPSYEKYNDLKQYYVKPFFADFKLVNDEGDEILNFETNSGLEINEQDGWLAFNAKLPDGTYYLLYLGNDARQIPIYVFKDWHTQFFITLGKVPLFGTIRIFLSEYMEFDPHNSTYKHIDILLNKLQNQDFTLDEGLIQIAASGKYRAPMLGLICSYIYLKSDASNKDWLFKLITSNMQRVILKNNLESPDIRAMNILASEHFPSYKFKKTKVQGTPMFRIGFEAILRASVENKQLISQNTINDYISENLYYDSPYNTFKPIPFPKKPKKEKASLHIPSPKLKLFTLDDQIISYDFEVGKLANAFGKVKKAAKKLQINIEEGLTGEPELFEIKKVFDKRKRVSRAKKAGPKPDRFSTNINVLFDDTLINYVKDQSDAESADSWLKVSISDIVKKDDDVSINSISNNLGVSGNTVNRIFNEWKVDAEEKLEK